MLEKRQENTRIFSFRTRLYFGLYGDWTSYREFQGGTDAAAHPRRIQRLMDMGVDIDDIDNYM
jgi:hypothetical protein